MRTIIGNKVITSNNRTKSLVHDLKNRIQLAIQGFRKGKEEVARDVLKFILQTFQTDLKLNKETLLDKSTVSSLEKILKSGNAKAFLATAVDLTKSLESKI